MIHWNFALVYVQSWVSIQVLKDMVMHFIPCTYPIDTKLNHKSAHKTDHGLQKKLVMASPKAGLFRLNHLLVKGCKVLRP